MNFEFYKHAGIKFLAIFSTLARCNISCGFSIAFLSEFGEKAFNSAATWEFGAIQCSRLGKGCGGSEKGGWGRGSVERVRWRSWGWGRVVATPGVRRSRLKWFDAARAQQLPARLLASLLLPYMHALTHMF